MIGMNAGNCLYNDPFFVFCGDKTKFKKSKSLLSKQIIALMTGILSSFYVNLKVALRSVMYTKYSKRKRRS